MSTDALKRDLTRLAESLELATHNRFRPIGSGIVAIYRALGGREARYVDADLKMADDTGKATGSFAVFTEDLVALATFTDLPSAFRFSDNKMGPFRTQMVKRSALISVSLGTPEVTLPHDMGEGFGETHWMTTATLVYAGLDHPIELSKRTGQPFDDFYLELLDDLRTQ